MAGRDQQRARPQRHCPLLLYFDTSFVMRGSVQGMPLWRSTLVYAATDGSHCDSSALSLHTGPASLDQRQRRRTWRPCRHQGAPMQAPNQLGLRVRVPASICECSALFVETLEQ